MLGFLDFDSEQEAARKDYEQEQEIEKKLSEKVAKLEAAGFKFLEHCEGVATYRIKDEETGLCMDVDIHPYMEKHCSFFRYEPDGKVNRFWEKDLGELDFEVVMIVAQVLFN